MKMGELIHRSREAVRRIGVHKLGKTFVIFCPGKSAGSIENYVLIPIEGEGLIAIKQEIKME